LKFKEGIQRRGEVGATSVGSGVGLLNKETRKLGRRKQSLFMVSWIPYLNQ
jgi:hypothetical protein